MKYRCSCGDVLDLDEVFELNKPIEAALECIDWAIYHAERGHIPEKVEE